MGADRWQRLNEIFHAALALDPDERSKFIAQACVDDDSLRLESSAMLSAHERAETDLGGIERLELVLDEHESPSLAGLRLGPYLVSDEIGRGGMGSVWVDGRGHPSEGALAELTGFFLEACLDQVKFMEDLVQPEKLHTRIKLWAREEEVELGTLHEKSAPLLEAILYRGELPRGEIGERLGTSTRTANRVVAGLIEHDVVTSESTKAPLRISCPARLASRWMPGLFPEQRG